MTLPQGPNQRWSLDFVSDTLAGGRPFRVLVVVDDFTRECLRWWPVPRSPGVVSCGNLTAWSSCVASHD